MSCGGDGGANDISCYPQMLAYRQACENVDSSTVEMTRYNKYFSDITGAGLLSKARCLTLSV